MPADIHHAAPPSTGPRLNATRARQGRRGRHVFWVLVVSTVLAALALFGAWSFRANDLAAVEVNNGAKTPAEAQRYDTQQTPARQTP
jgi:type VI protein secretion system component VasK